VFVATGVSVFHGARLGYGSEVRVNGVGSSHRIARTRRDQHTLVPAAQSPEAGWEHLPRITRKSRSSISATGLGLFWRLEYQPELCRMPRNGKLKVAELRFVPNPASL
jgi:hypothetical protein